MKCREALLNSGILDEFRQFIHDSDLRQYGALLRVFPKWTFDRSALSQFGIAVVGVAIAARCLVVSFTVVISDKPEEQLPFQQAMWEYMNRTLARAG